MACHSRKQAVVLCVLGGQQDLSYDEHRKLKRGLSRVLELEGSMSLCGVSFWVCFTGFFNVVGFTLFFS